MRHLRRFSSALLAGGITLGTVLAVVSVRGGGLFSPGPLSSQGRGTTLGGVTSHAEIAGKCSACHAPPWSRETMASRCLSCHTNVREQLDNRQAMHGLLADGGQCRNCHTEHKGAHASLTNLAGFDHDVTAFKLTGKHRAVDCKSCHKDNVFRGTPQTCASCHTEPKFHKGRFSTRCAECHSTTTWAGARFDHDRTAFPLTGKHRGVDCKSCHKDSVYKGTPQTCASCHAEPQSHKGRFGTHCASCHSTTTWAREPFKHRFPITHGQRRRRGPNTCATCHPTATVGDYKSYTCYGCHEHEKSRMVRRHSRRQIANLERCADCHLRGRGRDRRRAEALEAPRVELCAHLHAEGACPEGALDGLAGAGGAALDFFRVDGPRRTGASAPVNGGCCAGEAFPQGAAAALSPANGDEVVRALPQAALLRRSRRFAFRRRRPGCGSAAP